MSDAIMGFSSQNVGDLITVLEKFYGAAAEQFFTRAGLFIPHELRVNLLDSLLSCSHGRVIQHDFDFTCFKAMLDVFKNFQEALRTYCAEFFGLDGIIKQALSDCSNGQIADGFYFSAAATYLRSLFSRHIVEPRSIFAHIEARLRKFACDNGYMRSAENDASDRLDSAGRDISAQLVNALQVMGMRRSELSPVELKKKYKSLVKLCHPDINPSGLETCKRINVCYAFLNQFLAGLISDSDFGHP